MHVLQVRTVMDTWLANRNSTPKEALEKLRKFKGMCRALQTLMRDMIKSRESVDVDKCRAVMSSISSQGWPLPLSAEVLVFKAEAHDLARFRKWDLLPGHLDLQGVAHPLRHDVHAAERVNAEIVETGIHDFISGVVGTKREHDLAMLAKMQERSARLVQPALCPETV